MNADLRIVSVDGRPVTPEDPARRYGQDRVYFMLASSVGMLKIGTSYRLHQRIAELQLMSPVPLEIIGHVKGGAEREREYHEMFAVERSHGEWFRFSADVEFKVTLDCIVDAWNDLPKAGRAQFFKMIQGR